MSVGLTILCGIFFHPCWIWKISHRIMPVPQNIVMDMNNVMTRHHTLNSKWILRTCLGQSHWGSKHINQWTCLTIHATFKNAKLGSLVFLSICNVLQNACMDYGTYFSLLPWPSYGHFTHERRAMYQPKVPTFKSVLVQVVVQSWYIFSFTTISSLPQGFVTCVR